MKDAMKDAINDANLKAPSSDDLIRRSVIGGLITCPAVVDAGFMFAHKVSSHLGLLPHPNNAPFYCKSLDVGGASPISAIIEASRIFEDHTVPLDPSNQLFLVIVGDCVGSLPSSELFKLMMPGNESGEYAGKPVPLLYDEVAQWYSKEYGASRDVFSSVSVLMSQHASHNPKAMSKKALTNKEILQSPKIGKFTTLRECARRADGAAAILIASDEFVQKRPWLRSRSLSIEGRGECSNIIEFQSKQAPISKHSFCLKPAFESALREAKSAPSIHNFNFFGIYDCFPVCFLKSIEDIGIVPEGQAGPFVSSMCEKLKDLQFSGKDAKTVEQEFVQLFPFNTHGGLMHFAAPWESPAAYNVIEAVRQLRYEISESQRQIQLPVSGDLFAIATGNGGIFSSSSVIILRLCRSKMSRL